MKQNTTSEQPLITDHELAVWTWLVRRGILSSISGLSKMLGEEFSIQELEVRQISIKENIELLGGPDNKVICIYLTVNGEASGHLLLIHDQQVAFELIDHQMGPCTDNPRVLGEIEYSLLGEMGNIVGAFFLNVLADVTNLDLSPSPPDVMIDSVSSVISLTEEHIDDQEETYFTVKALFGTPDHQMAGKFLVIPTIDFMKTVLKHARVN